MKIVAADGVADLIRSTSGRLYVWTDPQRCCGGGITYLRTALMPAAGHRFERFETEGFQVFIDPGTKLAPDELHLEIKGWRTKWVDAFWNGCVFAN